LGRAADTGHTGSPQSPGSPGGSLDCYWRPTIKYNTTLLSIYFSKQQKCVFCSILPLPPHTYTIHTQHTHTTHIDLAGDIADEVGLEVVSASASPRSQFRLKVIGDGVEMTGPISLLVLLVIVDMAGERR
jgi:hypothetical protein